VLSKEKDAGASAIGELPWNIQPVAAAAKIKDDKLVFRCMGS